jgi:hypothetical protein
MDQLNTKSQVIVLLASLLALLGVTYVDYITGYDVLFHVFYFLPVALCGWFLGWGSTLSMAALCGGCWLLVDKLTSHPYAHEGVRYWNTFICFVAFAIIGLAVHGLRRALREQRRAQQELAKVLEDLRRSTEEIRQLQAELQVVCSWTKRIRVNGQWIPLDKFLADKLHFSISHGISPEALDEVKKALNENRQP